MAREQRIAIVVDRRSAYSRAILRGFIKYVGPARRFIHTWPRDGRWTALDRSLLHAWRPMGIVAQGLEDELVRDVAELGIPLVDVSAFPRFPGAPYVGIDHVAEGRMVAEEFLAQGLRHAAYFGWDEPRCDQQLAGLRERFAASTGTTVDRNGAIPPFNETDGMATTDAFLAQWLLGLPKPTGLMLYDDTVAAWLTQACHQAGLRVPEDVAIIGVCDDETSCQLAYPAVSSVEVPGEKVGYEAARILGRMLDRKESRPSATVLLPPIGVVARQSSDLLAVEDDDVASAVRFIRQNAHRPLRVSELHATVAISPRRLEQRFKKVLSRTPAAEIQRVHLNRAAQLLSQTNLPLRTIAKRSGFADVHHLCHAFRRVRGQTPNQYRRQFAIGATPAADEE